MRHHGPPPPMFFGRPGPFNPPFLPPPHLTTLPSTTKSTVNHHKRNFFKAPKSKAV